MGTRDDNGELWNFDDPEKTDTIWEYVKEHQPLMVVGSHVQAIAERIGLEKVKGLTETEAEDFRRRNKEHQQFLAEVYEEQANGRRYYIHEMIESDVVCGAIEKSIQEVVYSSRAERVKLGEWANDCGSRGSINLITNSIGVKRRLSEVSGIIERRFTDGDENENRYGREGEKTIRTGLIEEMRETGRLIGGRITPAEDRTVANLEKEYWDNISGEWLNPTLVKEARKEEMEEFNKHKVYTKVPLSECYERTGTHPIGTRWVDANKGDEVRPEYRSRLVAQEIKVDKREDLFAATPPLEAKKMLISTAVIEGIGYKRGAKKQGMKIDFIDVRRAYFHAMLTRAERCTLNNQTRITRRACVGG